MPIDLDEPVEDGRWADFGSGLVSDDQACRRSLRRYSASRKALRPMAM